MELIGSNTSPFVRRIRVLLAQHPHTYTELDIYADGRPSLARQTPLMKIPVLIDRGQPIYDSRVIARYLQQEYGIGTALSWTEENQLTLIDGALDSLVILLLSRRSGLDTDTDALYYRLQRERIAQALTELERSVGEGSFSEWSYPALCLYTLVDWASFRELIDLELYPNLKQLRDRFAGHDALIATDPRNA